MAYSVESSQVSTIVIPEDENVVGIIHNSIQDKIYWSTTKGTRSKMYRGNKDGSHVETLWATVECKRNLLASPHGMLMEMGTNKFVCSN